MVRTRREALLGVGALLAGLSGCSGVGDPTGTPSPTATARPNEYDGTVDDPTNRTVRDPSGEAAVRSTAVQPTMGWDNVQWLVTDRDEREALYFPDAAEGAESARSFVAETDLSSHHLLVHQYRVRACDEWSLERLRWRAEREGPEGSTAFDLAYRGSEDSTCEGDPERDVAATLVRVPTSAERVGAFSVSVT